MEIRGLWNLEDSLEWLESRNKGQRELEAIFLEKMAKCFPELTNVSKSQI